MSTCNKYSFHSTVLFTYIPWRVSISELLNCHINTSLRKVTKILSFITFFWKSHKLRNTLVKDTSTNFKPNLKFRLILLYCMLNTSNTSFTLNIMHIILEINLPIDTDIICTHLYISKCLE